MLIVMLRTKVDVMFKRTVSVLILACLACDGTPSSPLTDAGTTPTVCGPEVVDDMEDGEGAICESNGRSGAWYVAADGTSMDLNSQVNQTLTPTLIPDGRGPSRYAARLTGSGFTGWGALMGLNLKGGTESYDASAASGIKFWLKSTAPVAVNIPVPDTIPSTWPVGTCEDSANECYANKFHFTLGPSGDEWVEYEVPFAALRREVAGAGLDPSRLVGIEFVVGPPEFDVWVDDIRFYQCAGDDCVPTCPDRAFSVACPATSDFPAHCWPEGTDCSSPTDVVSTTAVWGSGPDDVWAVGYSNVSLAGTILHWDGSAWSRMTNGITPAYWGAWGSGSNDVWAVGGRGSIHHSDGSTWSAVASGTTADLTNGVWGSGPSDVWATGTGGTIVHWDGSAWAEVASRTTQDLWGVWGSDPSDVWAVGLAGTIVHWDGSAWSPATSGTTLALDGVWGSGADDVWAVGEAGTILHWDGSAWTEMTRATARYLELVWGSGADDVWAVGEAGTILHWDGSAWTSVASGTAEYLWGLWGSGPSDVWAAGDSGTMLHWDGSSWSAVRVSP